MFCMLQANRMNKAKEEGWKHVIGSLSSDDSDVNKTFYILYITVKPALETTSIKQ